MQLSHSDLSERSILYPNIHYYSWRFIKVRFPAEAPALSEDDRGYASATRGHTLSSGHHMQLFSAGTGSAGAPITASKTIHFHLRPHAYSMFTSLENIWLIVTTQKTALFFF